MARPPVRVFVASMVLAAATIDVRAGAFVPPTARTTPAGDMILIRGATIHFGAQASWQGATPGSSGFAPTPDGVVVNVGTFAIDRTEVTAGAYRTCVQAAKCPALSNGTDADHCNYDLPAHELHPINCVSFDEAKAFCAFAGKRLVTEVEYELAERGTTARAFPWGDTPPTPKQVNACDDSCVRESAKRGSSLTSLWADPGGDDGWPFTAPVGSYPNGASPYGVLDLSGNVEEWVSDPWSEIGAPPMPASAAGGGFEEHVVRGGSWDLGMIDHFAATRRTAAGTTTRTSWLGFRCARDG